MLALIGSLALASCNRTTAPDVSGSTKSVTFKAMLPNDAVYKSSTGTGKYVDLTGGDRRTTLTAGGLKPSTSYLAHYHKMGTADATDPCKSSGDVVGGVIATMTSDANGALILKGFQTTDALKDAKYINIHEAASLATVPLCAPL
ncbi:hypothetical protein DEMA109039_19310 [Deinococcus marmoris]